MVERRFDELRETLLRIGVAKHRVCRAVLEIESHFQQLIDEARKRGVGEEDARIEAHGLLGTNEMLVLRFAARPELCAWSCRWPAIWFVILPLMTYLAASAATLMAIVMVAGQMAPYLHKIPIAPQITHGIDMAARIVLLWVFPMSVATAFAVFAYRRRVGLRWPLMGVVLISALVSLLNVSVSFTGGPVRGEIGAGIGFSPESLPGQLLRTAILALPALVPLWLALRRARRDCKVI